MSEQSTQHATPTVQVREVGLHEQTSAGKVIAIAGVAGAVISALIARLTEKEEVPPTRAESAKAYLQSALDNAQRKDLGKAAKKKRKAAEKSLKRGRATASKNAEVLVDEARTRANQSAASARGEFNAFLETLRGGGTELERLADEFAGSTLMNKLRAFGEEAREIAEQGKMKSVDVAHKAQSDLIPQAVEAVRHAGDVSKERAADVAEKARTDLLPAAQQLKDDLADKAKNEFIPAAQKVTADVKDQAKDVIGTVSHDASKVVAETTHTAAEKGKQAGTAVGRGGKDTGSLLVWLGLAGALVYSVFLDEEQQKKLKEIASEVFGEARDMYADMKGDQHTSQ